ncbi:MAG: hypothetical protein QM739_17820 [Propionivibrio sp.]
MSGFSPDEFDRTGRLTVVIDTEHGTLHGQLDMLSGSPGLVVLAHDTRKLDARDQMLAGHFHNAGLSTLSIDLLAAHEENFPDIHNNVPLLAKRLLDFLETIKHRTQMGELPEQPIGLFAANATSPVVVRVASLRDHDIAAIVCRGGLIDLAGVLYLRSLESPILMLVEETDEQHATSNRRALREVSCAKELKLIPEIGIDYAISAGFELAVQEATHWFHKYFADAGKAFFSP